MNDFESMLYRYAVAHQVEHRLLKEQEPLEDSETLCAASLDRLSAALAPALRADLEHYIAGRNVREDIRTEAFFLSGLSMGLSLCRLSVLDG